MLPIGSRMLPVKTGSVLDQIGSIPNLLAAFQHFCQPSRSLFAAFQTFFYRNTEKKEFPKIEKYETAATHTYKVCVDTGITYHLGKNLGEGVSANPSQ